jgi:predicted Holliday junction resolvase-like endonuclease
MIEVIMSVNLMAILSGVFGVLVAYITHLRSSNSGLKKDLKQSQSNEAAAIEAIEKKQMLEKAIADIEQKTNDGLEKKHAEFDKNPVRRLGRRKEAQHIGAQKVGQNSIAQPTELR